MALHEVTIYLRGGQTVSVLATEVDFQRDEETGYIVGYNIQTPDDYSYSLLYLVPGEIAGVKSILLQADDEEAHVND